ncbi:hypothetical protein [Coprobacter fastidiosus]|uniref:hypothetical protein n=1 Tax=Coprobacter fastidiosus TaxID=1099853 RepID=UPI0002D8BF52|nr:hypothetical protein [Coprobacter fastidiosus]
MELVILLKYPQNRLNNGAKDIATTFTGLTENPSIGTICTAINVIYMQNTACLIDTDELSLPI